ncbi:aminoglycoside phosphotransferase family protein [Actinokineospora terrae]|uniref:Phosphotransferase enzyme family protein n=1 Tax=Actinokineospora terrae TaxID=155974 RepID=A0A1H9XH90_9PSEU|nr:aminoglycoside phosphotransferase family protein [Actinokineospora terrae]SES45013.1 Phosphotransferase enzyme family protein [Actinokineospora terrae]
MEWIAECSVEALTEALRVVAPELVGLPITLPDLVGRDDPLWRSSSAAVGEGFVAKLAWSAPAARRLAHEIGVLTALSGVPFLPEVVAGSTEPVLLVTRRVPGESLFAVVDSVDRDHAGSDLARFLRALHDPATRERVEQATGALPPPRVEASTEQVRAGLGRWLRPDQRATIATWCDWADAVLATRLEAALVHADLHGDNQVWRDGRLRLVVDFETVSAAEPEYDLRAFPDVELLTATVRHYERLSGRALSIDRIMAWHLRATLDDALWRTEAGVPLPDHRTPAEWVDDLATRFAALDVHP